MEDRLLLEMKLSELALCKEMYKCAQARVELLYKLNKGFRADILHASSIDVKIREICKDIVQIPGQKDS